MNWNPNKENVCLLNKKGHYFSLKIGKYRYCEYCGANQCFNCQIGKEYIKIKKLKQEITRLHDSQSETRSAIRAGHDSGGSTPPSADANAKRESK